MARSECRRGGAIWALREAGKLGRRSLASEGGGYVVMGWSLIRRWNDADDGVDKARAETAPDTAKLLDLDGRVVLALGTP